MYSIAEFKLLKPSPIAQLVAGLEDRRLLVESPAWPILFPRIDDSHCNRIHSSLTTVHCFDNGYVGKQPVAWEEYYTQYLLKELQECMGRCTGCSDIIEILLKIALTKQQNFRLVQIESICKPQNKCNLKLEICLNTGRKYHGKRRKCWSPSLMILNKNPLENILGEGENAGDQHFLFFL